jgi:hypothetical protein
VATFCWLGDRFNRATATFAPMDVRALLVLVCLPLAYQLLSFDFSALGDLCDRQPFYDLRPHWLIALLTSSRCALFAGNRANALAVATVCFLALSVIRPSRIVLGAAIVFAWTIDTVAAQFRFNMFTTDTPLALLTLVFLSPVRISRAAAWEATPNRDAQIAMLVCLIFVATYYVQAGISKLLFDWHWVEVVRIGNYYPRTWLWFSQVMPSSIEWIARPVSEFLRAHPIADAIGASIVLFEQFAWLAAPFGRSARMQAAIFAALYHLTVMLVTGIVFSTWIPIALAVAAPLSSLRRWRRRRMRDGSAAEVPVIAQPVAVLYVVLLASAAAWIPTRGWPYPPFYNYQAFGWRYPAVSEIKQIYRLGYRDVASGDIDVVPLGYGGFLEYRHVALLSQATEQILKPDSSAATVAYYEDRIETLLIAARPANANGWLLGRWRLPDHLMSNSGDVRITEITDFLLLKGIPRPSTDGTPARALFEICGDVRFDRGSGHATFDIYPVCHGSG